jgi:hypothetical protein
VVIDKSLTLQGVGDTTIVKPSSAAKLTQVFDGLFWYGGTKNIAGIIVANVPGGSVIVKNLKVDESLVTTKPSGADYLTGIFYRETGGTVDTVTIAGTGAWSGGDRAYGIYLSATTNAVSVEIKDSTITNFDKNGIEAMGDKLTVNIHHNTITGRGPISDEVQNGVHVGRDAVGTVNYNTISNLAYQPETWWSVAILFYHFVSPTGKSATANYNTITNCQMGIYFMNANGVAQGNTVSGGTVGLAPLGTEPDQPGTWTASFVGNTVSGAKDSPGYENAAIFANTYDAGASLTVTVDDNQLLGGGSTDADGISIGVEGTAGSIITTITNNTISNWQHGIRLSNLIAAGSIITGNTITNNILPDSGIHIEAEVNAANVSVNCNNIVGNKTFGIYNGGTGTLDAENNWWGCTGGPGATGCDSVSGNVDFTPWVRMRVPPGASCAASADTDHDGLPDTLEMGGTGDQNPSTTTDPLDADTDNDGLLDGAEDKNHNGEVDTGETDPSDPDTDNDGLLDGEDKNHNGRVDPGETDPLDYDTDDDGLCDGSASLPTGTACTTVSKSGRNGEDLDGDENPADRGVTETDPTKADTDGDGINDFDDDIPLRPGGGGCFGVVAYSTPSRVTYRPTARMASTRIIIVTIINNSGGDLIVTGGAFTPQPDEVFTIVRVSPTLPRTIRNGRRASFSVLTQVAAGKPPVTAVAPYFNIWLACGVVTSASVEPVELEGVRAELRGDELRVEANGSGIASIQLQLFDLAGRAVVNRTGKGSALAAPLAANASGKRLANGVYLYVVTVKGFDGSIQRSEVRKLVVLR